MATPTIREVLATSTSGGTASVTTGAGTASGDYLVVFHSEDWVTLADMTAPTGTGGTWAEQTNADLGTNNTHMKVWTRQVTSSGAQTVSCASHSGDEVVIHVYVLAGVGTIKDDALGITGAVTGNSASAPSVNPTGTDDLLLCAWASGTASQFDAIVAPGGMTPTGPTTNAITLYSASQTLAASGATGTRNTTGTLPNTRPYVACTIAIAGAASSTNKALSESGASSEQLAATATVPLVESATASDSLSVQVFKTLSDTGSASEQISASVSVAFADSAQASEVIRETVSLQLQDTALGTESILQGSSVLLTDTGNAADAISISALATLTETAQASDTLTPNAQLSLSDAGAVNESLGILSAEQRSLADSAIATDSLAVSVALTLSEEVSGTDSLVSMASVLLSDTGQGTDDIQGQPPYVPGAMQLLPATASRATATPIAAPMMTTNHIQESRMEGG